MHALMRRLVLEFQSRQPNVAIDLRSGGSTKAISEFIEPAPRGQIAVKEERAKHPLLVSSSRELSDSEIKQFKSHRGYEPLAIPIAVDAVANRRHRRRHGGFCPQCLNLVERQQREHPSLADLFVRREADCPLAARRKQVEAVQP